MEDGGFIHLFYSPWSVDLHKGLAMLGFLSDQLLTSSDLKLQKALLELSQKKLNLLCVALLFPKDHHSRYGNAAYLIFLDFYA